MTDLIVTKEIKASELIEALQEEFEPDTILETGLWIRRKKG